MSLYHAIRTGQAPAAVAQAAVRSARRWAIRPETALIARAELGPYAPQGAPDLAGAWVPLALHRWGRGLTFYREPSGDGTPGEIVTGLPWVVALGGGDCDDLAAAQGAIARALGLRAAVGLLENVAGDPGRAHVFLAVSPDWTGANDGRPWVVVDPQQPQPTLAPSWRGVRWFPL